MIRHRILKMLRGMVSSRRVASYPDKFAGQAIPGTAVVTRMHFFLGVFLVAMAFAGEAGAQKSAPMNKDFDEKPWEEQQLLMPGYPVDANLARVDVGPITSFQFFVDTESVNVGTDGVVRFTLLARSSSGGTNVSFEGMRCDTVEKKMYAVGRADGTWSAARNAAWAFFSRQAVNPIYAVLYEDFFCPERIAVNGTAEAVSALRNGGHPRGRTRR